MPSRLTSARVSIRPPASRTFHRSTLSPKGIIGGYWLLHLASSARARSAMTQIHWSKANRSKHYGYLGYDMLSYKPNLDQTQFIEGMSFDEESGKQCEDALRRRFRTAAPRTATKQASPLRNSSTRQPTRLWPPLQWSKMLSCGSAKPENSKCVVHPAKRRSLRTWRTTTFSCPGSSISLMG